MDVHVSPISQPLLFIDEGIQSLQAFPGNRAEAGVTQITFAGCSAIIFNICILTSNGVGNHYNSDYDRLLCLTLHYLRSA